jgi:hypothetical protein
MTVTIPWLLIVSNALSFGLMVGYFTRSAVRTWWWKLVGFFSFLYVPSRLFTLVEAFRTSYYLPLGAYVATWSASIPHLN